MAVSNDEKMLKDRLRHVLHEKKLPISKLADTETERARLGRQINGDAAVPFSTIYKVLYQLHDIDANWLILGEGYMLRRENIAPKVYQQHNEVHDASHNGGIVNVGTNSTVTSKNIERLEASIAEKDKRIAELEQDKMYLRHLVDTAYPHLNIKKP